MPSIARIALGLKTGELRRQRRFALARSLVRGAELRELFVEPGGLRPRAPIFNSAHAWVPI